MSLKDNSFRMAVLTALRDEIAKEVEQGRLDVKAELVAAFEEYGVKAVAVALPDGTPIATITLPVPKPKPLVDDAAQLDWVRENHPTEVIEVVRESFKKALNDRLKVVGDDVIDTRTGEAMPWATVKPPGQPSTISLRYDKEGRQAVAEAWREGRLNVDGSARPAIEGGES